MQRWHKGHCMLRGSLSNLQKFTQRHKFSSPHPDLFSVMACHFPWSRSRCLSAASAWPLCPQGLYWLCLPSPKLAGSTGTQACMWVLGIWIHVFMLLCNMLLPAQPLFTTTTSSPFLWIFRKWVAQVGFIVVVVAVVWFDVVSYTNDRHRFFQSLVLAFLVPGWLNSALRRCWKQY